MELTGQQLAILQTLSHFDVLNYPLSLGEVVKFSTMPLSFSEAREALNSHPLRQLIAGHNGLYHLKGHKKIIETKHERYRLALKKLHRATIIARVLRYFPWVKAIAVYSSLSFKNSQEQGDIDLFFITATNRAWSARFYINLCLTLFRLRPKPNNTKDKICTSYLVDENNLDLSSSNESQDYYYAYGTAAFTFLAGQPETINDFFNHNNWIKELLPNWQPADYVANAKAGRFWLQLQKVSERILGLIAEKSYRKKQLAWLPEKYRIKNDGKQVLLGDGVIKTHDNDKRQKFNNLFRDHFERILNSDYGSNT